MKILLIISKIGYTCSLKKGNKGTLSRLDGNQWKPSRYDKNQGHSINELMVPIILL